MNDNEINQIEINENSINLSKWESPCSSKWWNDEPEFKKEIFSKILEFNSEILDLNEFTNLKTLSLSESKIKKIIIPRNNLIKYVCIEDNDELEHIDFKNLNAENITEIKIKNNSKLEFNLNQFSKFINLKYLTLINSDCYGSFLSLRNLKKIIRIANYNTNIIPSYEYLFVNTSYNQLFIFLPLDEKKFGEIDQSNLNNKFLMNINKKVGCRGTSLKIKDFKNYNPQLVKNAEIIIEKQNLLDSLKEAFSFLLDSNDSNGLWWEFKEENVSLGLNKDLLKNEKWNNLFQALLNPDLGFRFWIEDGIRLLQRENESYYQSLF